jgi:GT2 family glycosyltransferase
VRDVDVITGCCLMIRTDIYRQTGGFDERFFMYAEEVDLCWRIRKLGWRLMFCPQAEIIHLVGASAAKAKPNRVYQINLGLLKLFKKHYGEAYAKAANFLMWTFYATRVPLMFAAIQVGFTHSELMAKATAYKQAMERHLKLFRRQYQSEIDKA